MENFDIVLFSPPSRMINHYRPPVCLLYIGGYLARKGLRVKIIDVPLEKQIRDKEFFNNIGPTLENVHNRMLDEFKKLNTGIVGISCYTPEYSEVVKLARDIRKINSVCKIIVGGIHPTFYPEHFFDADEGLVDVCVIGEGEITAFEVVENLLGRSKKTLSQIQGIAYREEGQKGFVTAQMREPSGDLDAISLPDYSLIDMRYYTNANPYAIRGVFLRSMYLLATRGCPSQCTFCVAKKLRRFFGTGRVRSANSLINELKLLKSNYAIDSFYFVDDLFTIDKENVKEFCRALRQERLGLIWGCSSKVPTLNEEVLKVMSRAGCVQIDFGVERGSDAALKLLRKGQNIDMVKNIFCLCHKYGIRTFANMLVNLPSEKEEDLNDILHLLDVIRPEVTSINIFTPYPGAEIYENSGYRFSKDEFSTLSGDVTRLIKMHPGKFKFSEHSIELGDWVRKYSKRYNRIFPNLKFYFTRRYWMAILNSKRKLNYLSQLGLLIREFINQKF